MPEYLFTEQPRPIIYQRGDLQVPATQTIEARSWLAAKEQLGYPLTPLQKKMVTGLASQFDLYGHFQTRGAGGRLYEAPKLPDATESFLSSLNQMEATA